MKLEEALRSLPPDAPEKLVEAVVSRPFLNALGFTDLEMIPGFKVGNLTVDHAARRNVDSDVFLHSKKNPYLYMEVKARTENLGDQSCRSYQRAANQLKQYLLHPSSKTVKWGVLMNPHYAQLFRKHGKVIHPATPCLYLGDNVSSAIKVLRKHIEAHEKALTVAVYNNKGGVGKTTTTLNLATTLALGGKRVLLVDFDPNQSDLSDSLNLPLFQGEVWNMLKSRDTDIRELIKTHQLKHPRINEPPSFDILVADEKLAHEIDEVRFLQQVKLHALRRALEVVKNDYDYILIDTPPNWRLFAKKAIFAADAVLIPARHDNLHSLQNAGTAIARYIPEIQRERQQIGEAGPVVLPIFLNNARKPAPATLKLMHEAIADIIDDADQKFNNFNLRPYFYPRSTPGHENYKMIAIPHMAHIAKADFIHLPAAFAFKLVREQYKNLVMEYFL